jgi:AcrR family transcriptional regulator
MEAAVSARDGDGVAMTDEKRPRRTKVQQRAETLEQILDAAEHLFSQHGLHGVTLKDVGKQAGFHTSLLHYYFDDKKAMFDAVFARRAAVTVERRMKALDDYDAGCGGKPTVEGALHAFLDPDLDLFGGGDEGWRNYATLGAQVAMSPKWGAELFDSHFDAVVLRLVGLLKRALPDCPEEDIFWGYHFVTGALILTLARTGRIDELSKGLCKSEDFAAIKARMARFMAAGFLDVCGGKVAA